MVTQCNYCHQPQTPPLKFKVCGRCKEIHYCSLECQTLSWKTHKLKCCIKAYDRASGKEKMVVEKQDVLGEKIKKDIEKLQKNLVNTSFFWSSAEQRNKKFKKKADKLEKMENRYATARSQATAEIEKVETILKRVVEEHKRTIAEYEKSAHALTTSIKKKKALIDHLQSAVLRE